MIPSHSGGQLGPGQRAKTHLQSGPQHNLWLPHCVLDQGEENAATDPPGLQRGSSCRGPGKGTHPTPRPLHSSCLCCTWSCLENAGATSGCTQSTDGAMSSTNPQELGVLSPIPPQQRGQRSPQCNQLHQGWLIQAQGKDNTFDLLWLGLYVPLTLFLGLHQEIDLLFFRENIIGINLPRQNPSDNSLAEVTAWLCSPNLLQESQAWVALGRFNNSPQTASSEHSQTWPQRGDPGFLSTLSPKAASGWVNGGLLRDVGQE